MQATAVNYPDGVSMLFETFGETTGYADATERLTKELGRQALETEKLSVQRPKSLNH